MSASPVSKIRKLWGMILEGMVVIGLWFLSNLLYTTLWQFLGTRYGIAESSSASFLLRHGPPVVPPLLLVAVLWYVHYGRPSSGTAVEGTLLRLDQRGPSSARMLGHKSEISIIVGRDGGYVETSSFNAVNIMKTMCVGVRNTGSVFLTNCKLMLEARRGDNPTPETWLRDGPFSLNVAEERYLSVATYNEPISSQVTAESWIRLSAPPSGNFWSPPMLPISGGTVTLRATSTESRECTIICQFWAKDGTFYWQTMSGGALGNAASIGNGDFVPLAEAAARAYGELRAVGSSWAKAADSFAQSGVREKVYFAGALAGEIPIYGKHPPSLMYEVIDSEEFKRGGFREDGATFHYHGDQEPKYVDLAVKIDDLATAIEMMKGTPHGSW
jgi:hypothetical protein